MPSWYSAFHICIVPSFFYNHISLWWYHIPLICMPHMILTPFLQSFIHTFSSVGCFVHFNFFFSDKFKTLCFRILVLCMPASSYAVNCQRLRSVPSLTLRTLEAMGYSVVPVSLQLWMNLPDYEKIPYLMQSIKIKCELLDSNEASVVH